MKVHFGCLVRNDLQPDEVYQVQHDFSVQRRNLHNYVLYNLKFFLLFDVGDTDNFVIDFVGHDGCRHFIEKFLNH